MIYLETPAGVGYSYSADAAYYQGVDDKMTGTDVSTFVFLFIYFQRFLYIFQSSSFFYWMIYGIYGTVFYEK